VPASPPRVLRLSAALLGTGLGLAGTRRVFHSLFDRALPAPFIEAMAEARPAARFDRSAGVSPLVMTLPTTAHVEGVLGRESVVVKDSLDVAGAPTSLGLGRVGEIATHDAAIVRRLREAGAQISGKAKMTELGMDGIGALMPSTMPQNPLAPGYIPGGSSTGTAVAVASGLSRYGIGGDGLGSVRIPAAYCGLVGLKPGTGTLSTEGYRSVAATMDVPGPMALTVGDCARLFQVSAGLPVRELAARRPTKVGLIVGLGPELASSAQRRAFSRALDAMHTSRVLLPVPGAASHLSLAVAWSTAELAQSPYAEHTDSAQGRLNITLGRSLAGDLSLLAERRDALLREVLRALESVEVLAMPTTAIPPPALTAALLAGGQDIALLRAIGAYTPLANVTGLPAIAVPSGRDDRGRPLSIMFVGRPGSEEALLEIAAAVEATGVGTQRI
jgi:Asp-tRNA(Asn)/Glu-tRNA(Gln) amidotransferase A subunit family amidase